jgi:hypothetical protein
LFVLQGQRTHEPLERTDARPVDDPRIEQGAAQTDVAARKKLSSAINVCTRYIV